MYHFVPWSLIELRGGQLRLLRAIVVVLLICTALTSLRRQDTHFQGQYPPWTAESHTTAVLDSASLCQQHHEPFSLPPGSMFYTRQRWDVDSPPMINVVEDTPIAKVTGRYCSLRESDGVLQALKLGPFVLAPGESLLFYGDLLQAPPQSHLGKVVLMQPRTLLGSLIPHPPLHLHHLVIAPYGMAKFFQNTSSFHVFTPFSYTHPSVNGLPSGASDITTCGDSERCKAVSYPEGFGWQTHGQGVTLNGIINNVQLSELTDVTQVFTVDILVKWIPKMGLRGLVPLSFYVSDSAYPMTIPPHAGPALYWTSWRMPEDGVWLMPHLHLHGLIQQSAWIVRGTEEDLALPSYESLSSRLKRTQLRALQTTTIREAQAKLKETLNSRGATLICAFEATFTTFSEPDAIRLSVPSGRYERAAVETTLSDDCQEFHFKRGDPVMHLAWMKSIASRAHAHSHFMVSSHFPRM